MSGREPAASLKQDCMSRTAKLKEQGITPLLVTVRVGQREDDVAYEKAIINRGGQTGVNVRNVTLPARISETGLLEVLDKLNGDESVHGILLFRPLPEEAAQAQVEYDRLRLGPKEFSERAGRIARGAPVRQVTEEDCELGSRIRCRAGRAAYWIDWQGNMMPCAQLPTPSFRVLPDGFDQAWRRLGQAVKLIRLPKECVGCPHERLCNACAAKCYSETGRFDVRPDYVCRFTHTLYEAMRQAAKEESEE